MSSEPHTVIPYVVIYADQHAVGDYTIFFRTNFGPVDNPYCGSEPANMDDEDSKTRAVGRIIASVLSVTCALRLDIEFLI